MATNKISRENTLRLCSDDLYVINCNVFKVRLFEGKMAKCITISIIMGVWQKKKVLGRGNIIFMSVFNDNIFWKH